MCEVREAGCQGSLLPSWHGVLSPVTCGACLCPGSRCWRAVCRHLPGTGWLCHPLPTGLCGEPPASVHRCPGRCVGPSHSVRRRRWHRAGARDGLAVWAVPAAPPAPPRPCLDHLPPGGGPARLPGVISLYGPLIFISATAQTFEQCSAGLGVQVWIFCVHTCCLQTCCWTLGEAKGRVRPLAPT